MSSQLTSLSEIQELVEEFSRTLLAIDVMVGARQVPDPELVNACFRTIHTVKGISAMVEIAALVRLSHALEGYLDDVRLGRQTLDRPCLDNLFTAVDLFGEVLASAADPTRAEPSIEAFVGGLTGNEAPTKAAQAQASLSWLDEEVLSVLTEYEEHRLRENIAAQRTIYSVHASFDLMDVDQGVERLKETLKQHGEVLTYLPSADASREDKIDLDILLGSASTIEALQAAVVGESVSIDRMYAADMASEQGGAAPAASPVVPRARPDTRPVAASATDDGLTTDSSRPATDSAPPLVAQEVAVADTPSIRSVVQTVRVELSRLDVLMNLVGELRVLQGELTRGLVDLEEHHKGARVRTLERQTQLMGRKIDALRDSILDVRMVPVGQMFDTLARVVRKLSREHDKDVRLAVSGEQTELDKLIVEELSDPLMHMIRNAIDHGIEPVEARSSAGKPLTGRITLEARQRGNSVVITVEDDGRGMRWHDIRARAVARGLVPREAAEAMTPKEALGLIFLPGFSTVDRVSDLSGRGVGMDVVKTNIMRLSGMIDVESTPTEGTRFTLTLPVTLAIIQALVIEVGGQVFCVPLGSVMESLMIDRAEVETVEGFEVINLRSETLPLVHLDEFFDLPRRRRDAELYVIVVGVAQHRIGLIVDDLIEQKDVVIKPLGPGLDAVPGLAGATEIGVGKTVLLLDLATILLEAVEGFSSGELRREERARP